MMRTLAALPLLVLISLSIFTPIHVALATVADPDQWADRVVQALSHDGFDALEKVLQEALPEPPASNPVEGRRQLAGLLRQVRSRFKHGKLAGGEQLDAQRVGTIFRRYAFATRSGGDHILFRFDLDNVDSKWVLADFYAGTDLNYVMRGDFPGSSNYKRRR